MQHARIVLLIVLTVILAGGAAAQASAPSVPSPALRAAVERYFAEPSDDVAKKSLEAIVLMPEATGDMVLAAIQASEGAITEKMSIDVPYRGQALRTTVIVPAGHSHADAPLPVIFEIGASEANLHAMNLGRVIRCFVSGWTPPEFSDEGRDGFLKVLRTVAHAANGDMDRLWLSGFSWAGHASFDTAMHRPGTVAGIVPLGGAPRRQHFRLMRHLAGVLVLAFCGEKDDPELVWNVREVGLVAPAFKVDATVTVSPGKGHETPLDGMEKAGAKINATGPRNAALVKEGSILADMPFVESPFLRIDQVDDARTKPPARVSVNAGTSPDEQRRAIIRSMESKVVKLSWRIDEAKNEKTLILSPDGVKKATVFMRSPGFTPGAHWTIRAGGKSPFTGVLSPDPRAMLEDARRTGSRLRPSLRTVPVF